MNIGRFLLLFIIHEAFSQYYYNPATHDLLINPKNGIPRGFKIIRAPKWNVKRSNRARAIRRGYCTEAGFKCTTPYQKSLTYQYECEEDYQCPRSYKCCQQRCFVHKICSRTDSTRTPNIYNPYHYQNKIQNQDSCEIWPYNCQRPYDYSFTSKFKCTKDRQCPRNYKCCQQRCFVHKICSKRVQYVNKYDPTDPQTKIEVPAEIVATQKTPVPEDTTTKSVTINEMKEPEEEDEDYNEEDETTTEEQSPEIPTEETTTEETTTEETTTEEITTQEVTTEEATTTDVTTTEDTTTEDTTTEESTTQVSELDVDMKSGKPEDRIENVEDGEEVESLESTTEETATTALDTHSFSIPIPNVRNKTARGKTHDENEINPEYADYYYYYDKNDEGEDEDEDEDEDLKEEDEE